MDAHIRKLAVRCHMSPAAAPDRERLSRLFRGPIADALDAALDSAGLNPREEICIRRLVVPSRLWLGMTDDAIVAAWTATAVDRLRLALEGVLSDDVVRYRSRTDAVLDAVRSITRGSTTRSWAWRRLGLPVAGERDAAVAALLLDYPPSIVPVFRALVHDRAFHSVAAQLDDDTIAAVVDAALAHAGRSITVRSVLSIVIGERADLSDTENALQIPRAIAAVARATAWRLARHGQSPTKSSALTLLALLEAEPAMLGGSSASVATVTARTVRALEGTRAGLAANEEGTGPSATSDPATVENQPRDAVDASGRLPQARPPANNESADSPGRSAADTSGSWEHGAAADVSSDDAQDLNRSVPRQGEFSDWAGLLFLVHIARDLDLATRALEDPALSERPLAWILQQVAMILVPAPPEDAAVRAFAGLPPITGRVDRATQLPLDDVRASERAALLAWGHAIAEAACARLEQPLSDEVLYELCARRGEVVAEPGWIEVRFSIDQVSVAVRRAGLDLDPDYVDWLGVVMKVVYA